MTFCGTLEHNRGAGFLTLALTCVVLYDPLLKIMDERYEKGWLSGKKGQLEMFPLTTKQRKEYAGLVKTLRYFLDVYRREEIKTKPKRKDPWSFLNETRGLEFCDYEFHGFWYGFISGFKNDFEFEKQVDILDQIAQGEPLKDYEPAIKFLSKLNSVALGRHNSYRRGCF
jgi:hypothetical protein